MFMCCLYTVCVCPRVWVSTLTRASLECQSIDYCCLVAAREDDPAAVVESLDRLLKRLDDQEPVEDTLGSQDHRPEQGVRHNLAPGELRGTEQGLGSERFWCSDQNPTIKGPKRRLAALHRPE